MLTPSSVTLLTNVKRTRCARCHLSAEHPSQTSAGPYCCYERPRLSHRCAVADIRESFVWAKTDRPESHKNRRSPALLKAGPLLGVCWTPSNSLYSEWHVCLFQFRGLGTEDEFRAQGDESGVGIVTAFERDPLLREEFALFVIALRSAEHGFLLKSVRLRVKFIGALFAEKHDRRSLDLFVHDFVDVA